MKIFLNKSLHKTEPKLNNRSVMNCISLFLFCILFFPNDKYNFKLLSFSLMMIVYIFKNGGKINIDSNGKRIIFTSIGLTFFLTLISFVSTKNIIVSFQGAYFWIFLLAVLPALSERMDIAHLAISLLKILATVMLLCMLLDYVGILSLDSNPVIKFLYDEFALIVKSPQYYTYYKITHKVNPLFIILFCYALENREVKWILATIVIVLISYSDVVLASLLLSAFILFLEKHFKWKKRITYILLVTVLCILLTFIIPFYRNSEDMLIRQSIVNEIKRIYSLNPEKILLGYGDKALIYVAGRASYEEAIEISYVEGIRRYGIIGMIPMLYTIIFPIVRINKKKTENWFFAAFLSYLVISSVNLFLFSSTAMYIYIMAYFISFQYSNIKKERYFKNGSNCIEKQNY